MAHTVETIGEVVARLDTAAADLNLRANMDSALGDIPAGTPRHAPLVMLKWAFALHESDPDDAEAVARWGSQYQPMLVMPEGTYPSPLSEADDAVLQCWSDALSHASHPIVVARLADLLWERRHGEKPYQHAIRSARARVELVEMTGLAAIDRAFALLRAADLATSLNNKPLQEEVAKAMLSLARAGLRDEERKPGVVLRLVGRLGERRWASATDLTGLLDDAALRYAGDVHNLDHIFAMQAELASKEGDEAAAEAWRMRQVETWIESAENSEGYVKQWQLRSAYERAVAFGFSKVAERILATIERMGDELPEAEAIESSVSLESAEVERMVEHVAGRETLGLCLDYLGSQMPVDVEGVEERVAERLANPGIADLVFRSVVTHDNAVVRHIDDDNRAEYYKSQDIQLRISFANAVIFIEALDRIGQRWGDVDETALAELLQGEAVYPEIATACARAFKHHWDGRHDDAAHVLVPRLEAAIRRIGLITGVTITKMPQGKNDGGFVTLGGLLASLEHRLPEDMRLYLRAVLCDNTSFNLRNDIAHGLIPEVDKSQSALLLHCLCVLRTLGFRSGEETA